MPVCAEHSKPSFISYPLPVICLAWATVCAIVLCAAINKIKWFCIIHSHFVVLSDRQIADETPVFGQVITFVNPSIATYKQIIFFILPEGYSVVIDMFVN